GAIDEHKPLILAMLSQLKLGMDLTKVVLPTFILERRSLLEMFADCMAHPALFIKIADEPSAELRMLTAVEWYLTSFHAARQGSIAKKPFNPILGETFHCLWSVANDFSEKDHKKQQHQQIYSNNSGANNGINSGSSSSGGGGGGGGGCGGNSSSCSKPIKLFYCAEQVSHHPPISAFYFECPDKGISMEASIWTRSKFMGMSVGVMMIGKSQLKLHKNNDEEYEFSLPSVYGRSILTTPWVELGDKVNITCERTKYTAGIVFHTKPFYGGKLHKITAEVKNPAGEFICHVTGEWNGVMEFNYANGQTKLIDTGKLEIKHKCVRKVSDQDDNESRRLWSKVIGCLKSGDMNGATEFKHSLEEEQRRLEKMRKEQNIPIQLKVNFLFINSFILFIYFHLFHFSKVNFHSNQNFFFQN
ncbi:hypothetical protein HELRODRAFT_87651, partial [Helobdella robusta]|uniref:Oxysterol-binding protein n=1 Tax=Helobdella robusta TaxID=6412 RepID=T1G6T7_HELRO